MDPQTTRKSNQAVWAVVIVVIVLFAGGFFYLRNNQSTNTGAQQLPSSLAEDARRISLVNSQGLVLAKDAIFAGTKEYTITSGASSYDVLKVSYTSAAYLNVLSDQYEKYFAANGYKELDQIKTETAERILVHKGNASVTITLTANPIGATTSKPPTSVGTKVDISVSTQIQ